MINRAFSEYAANQRRIKQATEYSDDIRGEALEKVLYLLEKTFKRAIERVGDKIFSLSVNEF